jgi:hypothetical protein
MKTLLSILSLSLAVSVAVAQDQPQDRPAQPNPQATTQTRSTESTSASTNLPEMKTTTFRGTLVDMNCAAGSPAGAATAATRTANPPSPDQANTANRAASDSGAACPVTASTTNFGMKLQDGTTVRFDLVGNQRAQDAVKSNKKWTKLLAENKPINAKVSGAMSGEKLIVSSIH